MKRRQFISKTLLSAMALPFATTKKALGWFIPALIIIAIAVLATIFYELWKTCQHFLGNPPPPPPDKGGNSIRTHNGGVTPLSTPANVSMLYTPSIECFSNIADGLDGFLTPDGVVFYTGVFQANVYDSQDGIGWTLTGTVTAWISENYIKVQNADMNGNVLSVVTTQDWKNSGALTLLTSQMQPANHRFFKMEPVP